MIIDYDVTMCDSYIVMKAAYLANPYISLTYQCRYTSLISATIHRPHQYKVHTYARSIVACSLLFNGS